MALSPGEAASIRAGLGHNHTFTRTSTTLSAEDSEGNRSPTPGAVTTGLRCRYRAEETLRTDTGGRVTVYRPSLALPHDSPLVVGDLVSAITDAEGTVLLAGPLAVESVMTRAAFGPVLSKRAYLRAGDIR
jgi:hypothetical protein